MIIIFGALLAFFAQVSTLEARTANDLSTLNKTTVQEIISPKTINELQTLIKVRKGPFSIAGARCSQGGQTIASNGIVIDMCHLNQLIQLDPQKKLITIQTGATWRDIQQLIDPYNLSIKVMQSYCDFSVGGSLSVNVHGRYLGYGPLIETVQQIKIITADGSLQIASRIQNPTLFKAAIGGYGGVGIIVEATLELTHNEKLEQKCALIPIEDYFEFFKNTIKSNASAVLHNGDLYPPFYNTILSSTWHTTNKPLTIEDRLKAKPTTDIPQILKLGSIRRFTSGQKIRASIVAPKALQCQTVVWRNYEAGHGIDELYCPQYFSTDLLQEYFIPVDKCQIFIQEMSAIFTKHKVNVLNVSLRHVPPNRESYLSWSLDKEAFAFVIYYEQRKFPSSLKHAEQWTQELIDAALKHQGTFYLPYLKHATHKQFRNAYPNSTEFFKIKKRYDPHNVFQNALLNKYA